MRTEAPGRSGWPSASFLASSSHSCVRYFGIARLRLDQPRSGGLVRRGTLLADAVAHTGEEIVLRHLGGSERASQDVLLVGVDGACHFGRQAEPELGVGV